MDVLLYIGSGIILIWGIAHIFPTRSVVGGFGELSKDNRLIITMEWVAEGLTLCFLGLLVLLVTAVAGSYSLASLLVYWLSAGMLVALSVLSLFTGARTSIIPVKICPIVKTVVAVLFILGSLL
jgi:hypothetical protein